MLGYLAGVPGRLKTLVDRLTSTWAAKLDTLHDTRITSARAGYLDNLSAGAVALAANYTSARAGYLDKLNVTGNIAREETAMLDTPIAAGLVAGSYSLFDSYGVDTAIGLTRATNATTSYADAVNYTGAGVISFAAIHVSVGTGGGTMEVIIDGVTCVTSSTGAALRSCAAGIGLVTPVSYWDGTTLKTNGQPVLCDVPFKTSLQIRFKSDAASTTTKAHFLYRKTA